MTFDGGAARGRSAAPRAVALAVLSAPAVVAAHLLTTGAAPRLAAVLAATLTAAAIGALVPARRVPGLAVLIGVSQLAGHAVIALLPGSPTGAPGCLPAVGRGAELGLRVTLLGEGGCPPGTYAGGTLTQAALAALVTAAAIVVGHVVVASAGGMLLAGIHGCREVLRAIRALVGPAPRVPLVPVSPRPAAVPDDARPPVPHTHVPVALTHRGPPVLGSA